MARKTVAVADLREWVNFQLGTSTSSPSFRMGLQSVIEQVLHGTGNYRGFRYLIESEVPSGEKPGIRAIDSSDKFWNTDNTRVYYF